MSKTDKDVPHWVRAMHSGRPETERHSRYCVEEYGDDALSWTVRRVRREEAVARRWQITWESWSDSPWVTVRVPWGPFECDLMDGKGHDARCKWWLDEAWKRYRWTRGPNRREKRIGWYGPERAAVRKGLRDGLRELNGCLGELGDGLGEADDVDWSNVPTRQSRHSMWSGGWWD